MIDWQRPERTEKWLRDWLRKHVNGRAITWVEPTAGATIGAPDALVHMTATDLHLAGRTCGGLLYPVELKKGYAGRVGPAIRIRAVVRPLQIRWHDMARAAGIRTTIVVVVTIDRESHVFGFPGHCAKALQSKNGESICRAKRLIADGDGLAMYLTNNDFWT